MPFLRFMLLASLMSALACSSHTANHQTETAPTTEKEKAFRQFLKKFNRLALPLSINTTGDFAPETFPEINPKSTDTLFVNNPDAPSRCFGILPDTTQYYGVIWLAPAEVYQVVLSTFTKSGEKISERQLAVGGCGDDCGFACSETLLLRPDYTIYSADSIASGKCNDAGEIIPGTTKTYVKMMAGRVHSNGNIELSGVNTVDTKRKSRTN